jgi:hypothetical protein
VQSAEQDAAHSDVDEGLGNVDTALVVAHKWQNRVTIDLNFELKARVVAVDGTSWAMEWIWRGGQTKDFPSLPSTNKPFEVRGATVVKFIDGKISRNSDY